MAVIGQKVAYTNPDGGVLVGMFQGTRLIGGVLYAKIIDANQVWHLVPMGGTA